MKMSASYSWGIACPRPCSRHVQTGSPIRADHMVFPCAVAYYYGREYPITTSRKSNRLWQRAGGSIILPVSLEYKFATHTEANYVQASEGCFYNRTCELNAPQLADISSSYNLRYEWQKWDITKGYRIKDDFDAIIIAKHLFLLMKR